MDDQQIIALYHNRDEAAIRESGRKYGPFCRRIALNIFSIPEDAEECVSDTWHAAWRQMPPERPRSLRAYLGRITRNLAVSRFRAARAEKRFSGLERMLSELDDCIPAAVGVEQTVEAQELGGIISDWLESLPEEDRILFVRRYWYGDAVKALAEEKKCTENQMAQRMYRMRGQLKMYLESKGVTL